VRLALHKPRAPRPGEAEVLAGGERYENAEDWGVPLYDEERAAESRRRYRELLERERQDRIH
jgi:hypothetical protein